MGFTNFTNFLECRLPGAGCRVPGAGCRVPGAGCRVPGAGCSVPFVLSDLIRFQLFGLKVLDMFLQKDWKEWSD